ncbi:MAG: diacylglycerol kinase family lipid kinase [Nanoarchaeota archaeon]|nr:diacylglycerol kinase family lipid kinase [Nanoarchaeota archaeon]MBU1854472.1 diacylglycerol kinase family lipid kinase [Nanoarchaeota archaeon]
MKVKLIINPTAGIREKNINQLKRKILSEENIEKQITKFFQDKKWIINISRTKKAGDGTIIARKSKNYNIIIAAGGDGTINEVINGMNINTKLGIIPLGSENVLAKELKISLNIEKACKIIYQNKTKKIDLGIINKKRFIFVAGIGFDADAITKVKPILKKLIGRHAYTVAGLRTLFEHKPEELEITINNKEKEKGYFVIISNVKRYGGNLKITPTAELDDGSLDLCVFKNKDLWSVMKYILGGVSGTMKNVKETKHYKITSAEIKSKKPTLYHTDAEIGGTTPVKIKVIPKKLAVIIP